MMRILLFIFLSIILKSQNIDPSPLDFDPNPYPATKYLSEYINNPHEYIRGFQWSVGIKISDPRALNMNAGGALESHFLEVQPNIYINKLFEGHSYTSDYQLPSRKMWAFSTLEHMPYFAQGILLEPSFHGDPNNYQLPTFTDNYNPIFGFETVIGDIGSNTDPNKGNKLSLDKNNNDHVNETVLSDPFYTDYFHSNIDHEDVEKIKDEDVKLYYSSDKLILTINLNRKTPATSSTSNQVLKIKVPQFYIGRDERVETGYESNNNPDDPLLKGESIIYKSGEVIKNFQVLREKKYTGTINVNGEYEYIIDEFKPFEKFIFFSEGPDLTSQTQINYNGNRGSTFEMVEYNSKTAEVYITDDMLPLNGDPVTICFSFICDVESDNKPLKKSINLNKALEDDCISFGLDVEYLGNTDLEIDYFRLENPYHRDIMFGKYDETLSINHLYKNTSNNSIKEQVDNLISGFNSSSLFKLSKIMLGDGEDGHRYEQYLILRYFNILLDNSISVSLSWPNKERFNGIQYVGMHHTGISTNWQNGPYGMNYPIVPYVKSDKATILTSTNTVKNPLPKSWEYLGLKDGYLGWAAYWRDEYIAGINPTSTNSTINLQNSFYESKIINGASAYNWIYDLNNSMAPIEKSEKFLRELWTSDNYNSGFANSQEELDIDVIAHKMYLFKPQLLDIDMIARQFKSNSNYYFNDKTWYAHFFTHTTTERVNTDSDEFADNFFWYQRKPWTGEQFRLYLNNSMIFGAKGYFVDATSREFNLRERNYSNFTYSDIKDLETGDSKFLSAVPDAFDLVNISNSVADFNLLDKWFK